MNLDKTLIDNIVGMSSGNPGAIFVMLQISENLKEVDPDCPHPILVLSLLEGWGITGSALWELYVDVCHSNIVNLLAYVRYRQLGMHYGGIETSYDLDFEKVILKVQERLPNFNKGEK
jgi:hypothetical protein